MRFLRKKGASSFATAAVLGAAVSFLGCGGDDFVAQPSEGGVADGSGATGGSGGTGGTGWPGSGGTSSAGSAGNGGSAGMVHDAGTGGIGGEGGSAGGGGSPLPACHGSPGFGTFPPNPTAYTLFTLLLNVNGSDFVCVSGTFDCVGQDPVHLSVGCTSNNCNESWVVGPCDPGSATARFASRVLNASNCQCDGENGNCDGGQEINPVTSLGVEKASCQFMIPP